LQRPSEELPGYQVPDAIISGALRRLLPADPMPVDRFACEHRWLNNPGGYTGRFSFDLTPYLQEPTRLCGSSAHDCVAVAGPGQSAKTTIAENVFMHTVAEDPVNVLWYLQGDDARDAYVKQVINPMIEEHALLADRLGSLPIDNSLKFKRFARMTVEFLGASRANLINKKAARIIADEWDAYDPALGDVKVLLDVRRQTFFESLLLALSHPDLATGLNPVTDWSKGIMALYADSDQRKWYWPCPHCGCWSTPAPLGDWAMTLGYDADDHLSLEEVAASAHLKCPHNGCVIADGERAGMNQRGRWIGLGQSIAPDGTVTGALVPKATAGFWIVGAMSPFVSGGIATLARDRVKAERDLAVTGDTRTLKEVIVKRWGFVFDEKALGLNDEIDPAVLKARAGGYAIATVPEGVRYLVAFVDVQKHRFVVQVEGYGEGGNVWLVDRFDIRHAQRRTAEGEAELVEPATYVDDWKLLVDRVIRRRYPLADGSGRFMAINLCAADSGGAEGVTETAYEFWRYLRAAGLTHRFVLTKGDGKLDVPRWRRVYPDSQRQDRQAWARGEVPVWLLNTNVLKDGTARVLRGTDAAKTGIMRFPEAAQLPPGFFEEYAAEKRGKGGVWERILPRNEALDCSYGCRALRGILGGEAIDWSSPPLWAETWDRNELVFASVDEMHPKSTQAPAPATPSPSGGTGAGAAAAGKTSLASQLASLNNRT